MTITGLAENDRINAPLSERIGTIALTRLTIPVFSTNGSIRAIRRRTQSSQEMTSFDPHLIGDQRCRKTFQETIEVSAPERWRSVRT